MDEWKATWDWARSIWTENEGDLGFNWFFRRLASVVAEYEGMEEVGSSDVWHLNYHWVKRAKESGEVTTGDQLRQWMLDCQQVAEYQLL